MSVILSHPTGNTFVRAALRALRTGNELDTFYTTISASPRVARWLPASVRRQFMRRWFSEAPASLIRMRPARELIRLFGSALDLRFLTRPGAWASVDAVYEHFDRHVARRIRSLPADATVSAVYCYEDAAEHTFLEARARQFACIYELPIAYWETTQRLLREEADRMPAWRVTLGGIDDPPEKLDRKAREMESADTVVVPSRFVLDSLPQHILREKNCVLAPFGSPWPLRAGATRDECQSGKLRVLFAGSMSQRKGLGDLFAAMRLLDRTDVELVVMGSLLAPIAFYRSQYPGFHYEAPRPHSQVLSLMQSCDVLVLPAIVEGRALVQHEALASGLPLIITPNSGGDDLVEEGRTGFLVPIRSPEAIAERLAWFADHRQLLPEMRRLALKKAGETGWARYELQVREAALQAVRRLEPRVPAEAAAPC